MTTVRVCVVGDQGAGKTSLVTSLVKDTFVTGKLQSIIPPIILPPSPATNPGGLQSTSSAGSPNHTTIIVDTSSLPQERETLQKELRKANAILLAYGDHYSYERIALFWIPYFRTLGLNIPVVLCATKVDLIASDGPQAIEEMLNLMNEWKEIDSCIRTSSKEHTNIIEAFFLCQKAVTNPVAPLYDFKTCSLKPDATAALRRIFNLCDKDQDGLWNDEELKSFQIKCFDRGLSDEEVKGIKSSISSHSSTGTTTNGEITEHGFLTLCKSFAEKGRHETIWSIVRTFHYTDSLSLQESFLRPPLNVPLNSSAELSPLGYRFFVDLFLLHDKDNDGGLSPTELSAVFAPTPGIPSSWEELGFPSCTVRNEAGYVTLQGWLAQWSMTTFDDPRCTLEYLAHLGFEHRNGSTAALHVTKARVRNKRRRHVHRKVERSVLLCYVLGGPGAGKSSLLDAFLQRPFDNHVYIPTLSPRSAVNAAELRGGRMSYLILKEVGGLVEDAILDNSVRLAEADLVCYAYDSSDPDSFAYVVRLHKQFPALADLPSVTVAAKADTDKTVQRCEVQPEEFAANVGESGPMHVSVRWESIGELWTHLAECATFPAQAYPKPDEKPEDWTNYYVAGGFVIAAITIGLVYWRKATPSSLN